MKNNYQKGPNTSVTDLQRVDMAREHLETAKKMQTKGLKRVFGDAIEHPLILKAARGNAEEAFNLSCMIQEHLIIQSRQFKQWMQLKKYKLMDGSPLPPGIMTVIPEQVLGPAGMVVPVPEYMRIQLDNLRLGLDYEVAQIGMIAGQVLYEDIIAETTAPKRPLGGVLRAIGSPSETFDQEEAQN